MLPLFKFLIRRLLAIPITLFVITAVLYGIIMLAPAEVRAELYMPRGSSNNPNLRPEVLLNQIVVEHGLDDPYLIQYFRWVGGLLLGDWGWSPGFRTDVLEALLVRTPATAELTLYSVLLLIPLGILGGGLAGSRQNRWVDHGFRLVAFLATSIPSFVLALVLLAIFYAGLNWFPPGRISIAEQFVVDVATFKTFTGLLTIDGLLNGRPDISLSALRHLVLPSVTLSMLHWATLGRVTRAAMIEEFDKDYIMAARGRGLRRPAITWRHALRNATVPALNSIALSTASLIMGVFVVEVIFGFPGVSELIVASMRGVPDTAVAMGFAVYSVLLVLPVMLILDILQALVDPRIREGAV
ncbi:MAG: ABC transporter permease [Anaerolineae bacterium]|nr:ABC transporter permease [Anaerolineae bacterium]